MASDTVAPLPAPITEHMRRQGEQRDQLRNLLTASPTAPAFTESVSGLLGRALVLADVAQAYGRAHARYTGAEVGLAAYHELRAIEHAAERAVTNLALLVDVLEKTA